MVRSAHVQVIVTVQWCRVMDFNRPLERCVENLGLLDLYLAI